MKTLFFFVLILFHSFYVFTQHDEHGNGAYLSFEVGEQYYIIADQVNVRKEASKDSKVTANLPIGTSVKIIEKLNEDYCSRGLCAPWYFVEYANHGKKEKGYLWGGLIAEGGVNSLVDPSVLFMYGLCAFKKVTRDGYSQKEYKMQVRACKKQVEISRVEFKIKHDLAADFGFSVEDNGGYEAIDEVLVFGMNEAQCGGIDGTFVLFWVDNKLHFIDRMLIGSDYPSFAEDAFIFPNDKEGQKGTIIREQKQGYHLEDTGDAVELDVHRKVAYQWTGEVLKPTKVFVNKKID